MSQKNSSETPCLVSAGGGKGGVGKSFLVANLGTAIARLGFQVILVDVDFDGANLHTVFGISNPPCSLADYVARREESLEELLLDTSIKNLKLITATSPNLASAHPGHFQRTRFLQALRKLKADFILLDVGAGMQPALMDYFLAADEGMILTTPEPTAMENAYRFLQAAFYRRIRSAMKTENLRSLVTEAMDPGNEKKIRTPLDLLRFVQSVDEDAGVRFRQALEEFRPHLILNQVQTAEEVRMGFGMQSVCRKHFGMETEYLGYINEDPNVRRALRSHHPFVEVFPDSDAALCIGKIAIKLTAPWMDQEVLSNVEKKAE